MIENNDLKNKKTDNSKAILYASNQTVVNDNLEVIRMRFENEPIHDIETEIFEGNKLSGCTMVMNRRMRDEILCVEKLRSSEVLNLRLHDTWCVIIAESIGNLVYDPESRILYRQHKRNVVGANELSVVEKLEKKIMKLMNKNKRCLGSRTARFACDNIPKISDIDSIRMAHDANTIKGKIVLIQNYDKYSRFYSRCRFISHVIFGFF